MSLYLGSVITEYGECTMDSAPVKTEGRRSGHHCRNMEKSQHTDFNEDTTNESASVACSNVGLPL